MKNQRLFLSGIVFAIALVLVSGALIGADWMRAGLISPARAAHVSAETPAGLGLAEVLLVDDDDNGPDVLAYYVQVLNTLGYSYNVWDTGNSDTEPDLAVLNNHRAVIWFTGAANDPATGPGPVAELALGSYLDSGACFFISGQDYSNVRGLTPFMNTYLGVDLTAIDIGNFIAINGEGSTYGDLSPFSLAYPFVEAADIVSPTLVAEVAFRGFIPNTYPAGVYHDGGNYKTTYLGFPLEATSQFDGAQILKKFLVDCFPDDIMVVDDDDNSPDVVFTYTQILDQLGYHYTIWDTDVSDVEPLTTTLENYEMVVWFSGDAFGGTAGPGPQSEAVLANWLEGNGACLFLSSQDYLYDRGITPFMVNYLGVYGSASPVGDVGQNVVTGTHAYAGLGPYTLITNTVQNYSDVFSLTIDAEPAFFGDQTYNPMSKTHTLVEGERIISSGEGEGTPPVAAAFKETNEYQTTWLGFPLELLPTYLDRLRTLHRSLTDCFSSDIRTTKTASDPVVEVGESFSYTIQIANLGPYRATEVFVQDFIPNEVSISSIASSSGTSCLELSNGNVNCFIPEMEPEQEETITISVTPNQAGPTTNFVFATNFGADTNPTNNSTSAFVRVVNAGDPDLYLDRITPNFSDNLATRNIQIFGANFQPNTELYLDGSPFVTYTFDVNNPDAIISATLPIGFQPGAYTVEVRNSGGETARLFKGLVIFDPSALDISSISPEIGPNDHPLTVDIFGAGFSLDMGIMLIDPLSSLTYPVPVSAFLSQNHVRGLVPYGVPPGTYDVEVHNTQGYVDTLTSSYQVVEWSTADELFLRDFDIFTMPASPREGQNLTIGLTIRRRTGDYAPLEHVQVNVNAAVTISAGGTPLATITNTGVISPNHALSMTFPWTPTASGEYLLSFQVTSPELVTDTIPGNHVISHTIEVRPPSSDAIPPEIVTTTVNGGAYITNQPQVVLNTVATDDGSGVAYIYYIEYAFDRGLGDWLPVKRSGWIPFENGVDMDYLLDITPGAHYIQAWVADYDGNISSPQIALINLILPKNSVVHDGGQVYRLPLLPSTILQIDLTSLIGDADMFAWGQDGNLVAAAFGSNPFEQLSLDTTLNSPGLYQIDVYGFETTSYWFETSIIANDSPDTLDEVRGHVKGSDLPLQVVDNYPGGDVSVPPPPGDTVIYLPLITR
ncbi:MAG: hypothetical protein Fur0022_37660 [Anaerolineales bacterium]